LTQTTPGFSPRTIKRHEIILIRRNVNSWNLEEAQTVVKHIRASYDQFKYKTFVETTLAKDALVETQTFMDSLLEEKFDSFNSTLRSNRYQTQTFMDSLLEEKFISFNSTLRSNRY
jgi:hypothetical protein